MAIEQCLAYVNVNVSLQQTLMPLDARTDLSHEALLKALAHGDGQAAQVLALELGPRAFAQAARMLKDRAEAEDVAQEALIRLWKAAAGWRYGEARITTWLYRVVTNLCVDRLRKRERMTQQDPATLTEMASDVPSSDLTLQTKRRARALEVAFASLPERQREAVILRHLEGFSNPEIADIMEISTEAVESLTARGKRKLASVLEDQKDELGLDL